MLMLLYTATCTAQSGPCTGLMSQPVPRTALQGSMATSVISPSVRRMCSIQLVKVLAVGVAYELIGEFEAIKLIRVRSIYSFACVTR